MDPISLLVPLLLKLVGEDPKRLAYILAVLLVLVLIDTVAAVLCAKWGMVYRGVLSRVMTRAEAANPIDSTTVKGVFRSEFEGERSLASEAVKALTNEVDPKKTPEPKSVRFGRFLRLVGRGILGR